MNIFYRNEYILYKLFYYSLNLLFNIRLLKNTKSEYII